MTDKQTRNDRYVCGDCVDCGTQKHSPGRTRCDKCHQKYMKGRA